MLPMLSATKRRVVTVVTIITGAISAIVLPDDLGRSWERIRSVGEMAGDNPIAAAALAVSIAVFLWANSEPIQRFLGGRRWHTDQELGDELHGWLRESGYQLQDLPSTGAAFNFSATGPNTSRPVNVSKAPNAPGFLLTGIIMVDAAHTDAVKEMTDDEMEDLRGDLGVELARSPLPLSFSGLDLLGQGFLVQHPMLATDTLTKSAFMERVVRVSAAMMLTQILMRRHIRRVQQRLGVAPTKLTTVPKSSPDMEDFRTE